MARAVRLKVYRTSAGFADAYVAAASQAAALKAWGVRDDLFSIGEAQVVTDEALTAEPLARPGEVVRRPRGDMAAMLAATPRVAKSAKSRAEPLESLRPTKPPPPPPPDRSALDAAEQALRERRERLARKLDAIGQERLELDRQEARARRDGEGEVKRLERSKSEAERAFRKAGGPV